jgi:crotonobetainyl-CoA:carnitine CoA-transferase CaiB-like acyl-CoA transferase
MPTPLAGLRLLDLSRQLPGPFCSTLLADLGMDVLAITAPGDPFGAGIPFLERNKRSMRSGGYLAIRTSDDVAKGSIKELFRDLETIQNPATP